MNLYLLRYGEIGTKSPSVRKNFENILIQNIERMFLKDNNEIFIEKRGRGRIFGYTQKENSNIFSRTFGIVSYSQAKEISSDLEEIKKGSRGFAEGKKGTFAVRARRTGDQDYSSQDVEEIVGSIILEENPDLIVNLDDPDHKLYIEIRNNRAYLFTEKIDGPGGLPLSSQGKAAAYVENRDDFIAAWLMMKRGVRCYIYYTEESEWITSLEKWDPNLKKYKIEDKRGLNKDVLPEEVQGIVTGEKIFDISFDVKDYPIFRPLIGLSDERTNRIFRKISELSDESLK